jgi:hypothetical protein
LTTNEYHIGLEEVEPNHWAAFVFELPGCFSSGQNQTEAMAGVRDAVEAYQWWIFRGRDTDLSALVRDSAQEATIEVVEEIAAHPSSEDPDYQVNAFFQDDARPLSLRDIQHWTRLLGYTREDLLAVVEALSVELLNKDIPDERFGSIAGILRHVAGAEQWYCSRLDLVEPGLTLPGDPFKALEASRANTILQLPELAGNGRITELVGEKWSARKILRRALWHERDHRAHIRKLINKA